MTKEGEGQVNRVEALQIDKDDKNIKEAREVKESRFTPEEITATVALDMMAEAKEEFTEDIRMIIEKRINGGKFSPKEQSKFDTVRNRWFKSQFGVDFAHRRSYQSQKVKDNKDASKVGGNGSDQSKPLKSEGEGGDIDGDRGYNEISKGIVSERELTDLKMTTNRKGWNKYWLQRLKPELDILPRKVASSVERGSANSALQMYVDRRIAILKWGIEKRKRMALLKKQLSAIDAGEVFYDEAERQERRIVFYDEEDKKFYIEEKGKKKCLDIGDIVADFTWGVRYFVSDSIPAKIKRVLEKRIVINEARREIENIYDAELGSVYGIPLGAGSMKEEHLESEVERQENHKGFIGVVAERAVREFLTKVSLNNPDLNFFVERSNAFEDTELKYDFKIRKRLKTRGIAIEGFNLPREEYKKEKQKFGLQMTVSLNRRIIKHKKEQIGEAKEKLGLQRAGQFVKRKVDDIVLVSLDLPRFGTYFKRWLEEGKPSGGPEQYMSTEEKKRVLLEATWGFMNIGDEDLNKIFPSEATSS